MKVGDVAILDKDFRNGGKVKILHITRNKLFATVKSLESSGTWAVMTNRLTLIENK